MPYLTVRENALVHARCPEAAARVAVHRLRKRYRQRLRREVAGTLSCESRVEEEMKALFAALSG